MIASIQKNQNFRRKIQKRRKLKDITLNQPPAKKAKISNHQQKMHQKKWTLEKEELVRNEIKSVLEILAIDPKEQDVIYEVCGEDTQKVRTVKKNLTEHIYAMDSVIEEETKDSSMSISRKAQKLKLRWKKHQQNSWSKKAEMKKTEKIYDFLMKNLDEGSFKIIKRHFKQREILNAYCKDIDDCVEIMVDYVQLYKIVKTQNKNDFCK